MKVIHSLLHFICPFAALLILTNINNWSFECFFLIWNWFFFHCTATQNTASD
jgi:hypothetical protein